MARTDSKILFVGTGGVMASNLRRFSSFVLFALIALTTTHVEAQRSFALASDLADPRTVKVQRKVEQLFERGDFERAYFIYRNELAPVGDKYAQYMVGFMHLTGMGIEEDTIAASAWYRLAAERGTPQFVAVRDMLLSDMTADERRQSDRLFLEVRREYSDLVILLASIKRGVRDARPATGSRLARGSSPMTIINANSPNHPQSSAIYYGRIESDLEQKLVMLAEIGDFPDLETDPARFDINEVERLVTERLANIQN
ncbi:MAG: hypothetical protein WBM80_03495 [Woeseiaceae bacterium]